MLTRTQHDIVKLLLSHPDTQYSIRHIARALKKSYTLTYNNIQKLIVQGILKKQHIPPAQIIHLAQAQRVIIEAELSRADDFLKKHPWMALYRSDVLRASKHPFYVIIVFGSYAKGEQYKKSDIDLLFIVPEKKDIEGIERAAQQYTPIKRNVIVIDTPSFTEMIKNPHALNVGNEARKFHLIIHNAETYDELIRHNEK